MAMQRRDFIQRIEQAGWSLVREGGSHSIYGKRGRTFPVPRHNDVKRGIVKAWEKLNKQIDEEDE